MEGIRQVKKRVLRGVNSSVSRVAASCHPLWRESEAVFVLSTGRTGTETLMHALNLSQRISAFHEPVPQLMVERKFARTEVHTHPDKYRRIFAEARSVPLLKARRSGLVYAETSARLTFFAPVIAELLPRARFLYIHRNPGEVIRSGMRRKWYVNHPADHARIVPTEEEIPAAEWEAWEPFKKICWYWDAYNRFALNFAAEADSSRILFVRAEELFERAGIERIYDFLQIARPPAPDIDGVLSMKHNAQTRADFPRYEQWTREMKDTLADVAASTMVELGYAEMLPESEAYS